MEPRLSSPCSQHSATCSSPEPYSLVCTLITDFYRTNFNIIFSSAPRSSTWPHSLTFPHQNPICTFPLPHTCHLSLSSHYSLFYHQTMLGEGYEPWHSSWCCFLHCPISSFILVSHIFISTDTCSAYIRSLIWETKCHTHTEQYSDL